MSNPLRTSEDYELFVYNLSEQFPSVRRSTVAFIRCGATLARVVGELYFDYDIHRVVRERLAYHHLPVVIDWYGYEVWRSGEKLYWYDAQPHPNEPSLQSTHPHHKHIPSEIKHHRIPAAEMSFNRPNLPLLIREIEALIEKIESASE